MWDMIAVYIIVVTQVLFLGFYIYKNFGECFPCKCCKEQNPETASCQEMEITQVTQPNLTSTCSNSALHETQMTNISQGMQITTTPIRRTNSDLRINAATQTPGQPVSPYSQTSEFTVESEVSPLDKSMYAQSPDTSASTNLASESPSSHCFINTTYFEEATNTVRRVGNLETRDLIQLEPLNPSESPTQFDPNESFLTESSRTLLAGSDPCICDVSDLVNGELKTEATQTDGAASPESKAKLTPLGTGSNPTRVELMQEDLQPNAYSCRNIDLHSQDTESEHSFYTCDGNGSEREEEEEDEDEEEKKKKMALVPVQKSLTDVSWKFDGLENIWMTT